MYDLADAPDDVKKPLFIDQAHVAGLCNEVIAKRILEILQADVCNDPPPHTSVYTYMRATRDCRNRSVVIHKHQPVQIT